MDEQAVEAQQHHGEKGTTNETTKPMRYSQLSPARQALVRLCQDVNFGQIIDLLVRNAEPLWDPGPTILSEVRLDCEESPRPEAKLLDFRLSSEILRLMRHLDQIKDGRIAKIEIREGIPRRLVLASRLAATPVH